MVGGSFVEGMAGHNPLEPARLGRAVISGPHVDAFADVYAELTAAKAVLIARDRSELWTGLAAVLREPKLAAALGARAMAASEAGGEGFSRMWSSLQALLPAP